MFWVLGGISEVFENILSYKAVFSSVKNGVSLWNKSVLVFDKDELSTEHKDLFVQKFREIVGIETYSPNAYTFESTLFTDMAKTSKLLRLLLLKATGLETAEAEILNDLTINYVTYKTTLEAKFNEEYHRNTFFRYKNSKIEKTPGVFGRKAVNMTDYDLGVDIKKHYAEDLARGEFYKLMDKSDVENVIKQTIDKHSFNFSIESDFIEIIKLVDKSTWIAEWDFLNNI
ncbi:MAG: hypothetical protein JNM41_07240 [Flavipsychrobacter sp.]|nr:hypothetical protein [Flavipsychrobacter sp.]